MPVYAHRWDGEDGVYSCDACEVPRNHGGAIMLPDGSIANWRDFTVDRDREGEITGWSLIRDGKSYLIVND